MLRGVTAHSAEVVQMGGGGRLPVHTIGDEQHIIEEVIRLWRRLEESDKGGVLQIVGGIPQVLDDLVRGARVQPRADFVQ